MRLGEKTKAGLSSSKAISGKSHIWTFFSAVNISKTLNGIQKKGQKQGKPRVNSQNVQKQQQAEIHWLLGGVGERKQR